MLLHVHERFAYKHMKISENYNSLAANSPPGLDVNQSLIAQDTFRQVHVCTCNCKLDYWTCIKRSTASAQSVNYNDIQLSYNVHIYIYVRTLDVRIQYTTATHGRGANRKDDPHVTSDFLSPSTRQAVDTREEQAILQREIAEEVEEEREQYVTELPQREALYRSQLAEWKANRKMRVREGEGGRNRGRKGGREGEEEKEKGREGGGRRERGRGREGGREGEREGGREGEGEMEEGREGEGERERG